MKVKTIKCFNDKKEGVTRKTGDTFIVSKERFKEINSTYNLVEEIKEEAKSR